MKTLVIGQAPSRRSDPAKPLSGPSGRRLADLCKFDLEEFLAAFDRQNLVPEWPGKAAGKGDRTPPLGEARGLAEGLRAAVLGRDMVVLGASVAAAFGFAGRPLTWRPHWGARFALCPHPSGVCHWWNDPWNVTRACRFWRRLARGDRP